MVRDGCGWWCLRRRGEFGLGDGLGFVQQAEVDFNRSCHRYRLTVLHTWMELPLADGLDGLFVEPVVQTLQDLDVTGVPGLIHFNIKNHGPLNMLLPRLFRILGLRPVKGYGRCYAGADARNARL